MLNEKKSEKERRLSEEAEAKILEKKRHSRGCIKGEKKIGKQKKKRKISV